MRIATRTNPFASQPVQEKPHPYRSRRKQTCRRRNPHTGRRIQTGYDAHQPISVATRTGEATPARITTRMDETASQSANGTGNPCGVRRKPSRLRRNPHRRSRTYTGRDANWRVRVVTRTGEGIVVPVATQTGPSASQPVQKRPRPCESRRKPGRQSRNQYRRSGP